MPRNTVVTAALAGVFYRKPSTNEPSYVEVGHIVKKGQVLGLLESMKVFIKLKSPVNGKVVEIVAQNEQTLSKGAQIMTIESSEA